jgi:serine protease AprX
MKKFFVVICILIYNNVNAGPTYGYRVSFTDKIGGLSITDASLFLTPASIARRVKFNIPIEVSDIPVVSSYINTVMSTSNAHRLHNVSKWFNQIVVLTDDTSNMVSVRTLPFVSSVKLVAHYPGGWNFTGASNPISTNKISKLQSEKVTRGSELFYGHSYKQIHLMNADYLHDIGFKGENMNIAVIDMGFYKMDSLTALLTMRALGHLKDTWNFVRDTSNVYKVNIFNISHGTDALSTMACNSPGYYVGTAPFANYYTYMSEDLLFESPIEEDNWVSAAERADSLGVQIINTSLGYTQFDADFAGDSYAYTNLDGKTTLIARANNVAVKKGIFCVASNGNSGANAWKYLLSPADGDSVYSVGFVDSSGNYNFAIGSSFGPSADGQVKPDGLSIGSKVAVMGNNDSVGYTGGSSFAGPTLCGAIACLMQALPDLPVHQIRKLVHQSSSRYSTPSDSMGYGIPNFKIAYLAGVSLSNKDLVMGDDQNFILYPNPSNDYFQISTEGKSFMDIKIMDVMGKIVIEKNRVAVNSPIAIQFLSQGLYAIQIIQDNKMALKYFRKL